MTRMSIGRMSAARGKEDLSSQAGPMPPTRGTNHDACEPLGVVTDADSNGAIKAQGTDGSCANRGTDSWLTWLARILVWRTEGLCANSSPAGPDGWQEPLVANSDASEDRPHGPTPMIARWGAAN
jgi:hypothetical protein